MRYWDEEGDGVALLIVVGAAFLLGACSGLAAALLW